MFNNEALVVETERLTRFAWRLTRNAHDAEDLVQSVLLKAMEKKHLFQEDTNLYSWLSKIMFNMFVSGYRRKVKFESQYDPEPYLERQSVKPQQYIDMAIIDLDKAMSKLSEDHRDILIMVCVKNMQYAEVADILGVPVGTVRSRLSRARAALEQAMAEPVTGRSTGTAVATATATVMTAPIGERYRTPPHVTV